VGQGQGHELWHYEAMADAWTPPAADAQPALGDFASDQRAWIQHSEMLWRRAHALARLHPEHDPSDLYHALRCLELTPAARLRAGFQRGRLRAYAR
jgi:hypothetical protein